MPEPVKMKITKPLHIYMMGASHGLMTAVDVLEAKDDVLKRTPGFQLALALVRAEAESQRAHNVSRNLAALARGGVNIADHQLVSFDPNTAEMVCEFYEPDLLDAAQ